MIVMAQSIGREPASLEGFTDTSMHPEPSMVFDQALKEEMGATNEATREINSTSVYVPTKNDDLDTRNSSGVSSGSLEAKKNEGNPSQQLNYSVAQGGAVKPSFPKQMEQSKTISNHFQSNIQLNGVPLEKDIHSSHSDRIHLLGRNATEMTTNDSSSFEQSIKTSPSSESEIDDNNLSFGTKEISQSAGDWKIDRTRQDFVQDKLTGSANQMKNVSSGRRAKRHEENQANSSAHHQDDQKVKSTARIDKTDHLTNSSIMQMASGWNKNISQDQENVNNVTWQNGFGASLSASAYLQRGNLYGRLETSTINVSSPKDLSKGGRGSLSTDGTAIQKVGVGNLAYRNLPENSSLAPISHELLSSSSFESSTSVLAASNQEVTIANSEKASRAEEQTPKVLLTDEQINVVKSDSTNRQFNIIYSEHASAPDKNVFSESNSSLDVDPKAIDQPSITLVSNDLSFTEKHSGSSISSDQVAEVQGDNLFLSSLKSQSEVKAPQKENRSSSKSEPASIEKISSAKYHPDKLDTTSGKPDISAQTTIFFYENKTTASVSILGEQTHTNLQISRPSTLASLGAFQAKAAGDSISPNIADTGVQGPEVSQHRISNIVAALEANVQNIGQSGIKVHASLAPDGVHALVSSDSLVGQAMLHQQLDAMRGYLSDRGIAVTLNAANEKGGEPLLRDSYSLVGGESGSPNRRSEHGESQDNAGVAQDYKDDEDSYIYASSLDSNVQLYLVQRESECRLNLLA